MSHITTCSPIHSFVHSRFFDGIPWGGGYWDLRFWLYFRSVFGFFCQKTFFNFFVHCIFFPPQFRFLFDLSSNYVPSLSPPLISNSCETSVCSTCHHCIGSIGIFLTGYENLSVSMVLHALFGFDGIFVRFWMIISTVFTVSNIPQAPLAGIMYRFAHTPTRSCTVIRAAPRVHYQRRSGRLWYITA